MRPEEERSQLEAHPEVSTPATATSPLERATALVSQWEDGLGAVDPTASDPLGIISTLRFTNDVRDRMRDDIFKLISEYAGRG